MESDTAPAPARLRSRGVFIGIAALAVVVVAGYLTGQLLARPNDVGLIQPGVIVEVQTDSGRIMVGTYAGGDADYLILADPADLSNTADARGLELRPLRGHPYSIAGNVLVWRSQVVIIGAIEPDSDLGQSYLDAMSGSAPTAEPSP